MCTTEQAGEISFDQNLTIIGLEGTGTEIAYATLTTLSLANKAIQFASIERVPRYNPVHRENDAEHSLMLSIIAPELANMLYPDLNIGLVHAYAPFHDLVELEVDDTPTFLLDSMAMAVKEQRETRALFRLIEQLPPYAASLLKAYEAQADPESRFVRCTDKLMPILVDILGVGVQVMAEDYGINSLAELNLAQQQKHQQIRARYGEEFPELVDIHGLLGRLFSDLYASQTQTT